MPYELRRSSAHVDLGARLHVGETSWIRKNSHVLEFTAHVAEPQSSLRGLAFGASEREQVGFRGIAHVGIDWNWSGVGFDRIVLRWKARDEQNES